MNATQERLLTLLLEVDGICRKHDITYYLAGGTALGAVRNGGFLPWDDDVDLYITRDNWNKLQSVIDQELAPDRALVSTERYEYYNNPIGRYVDKTNTSIMLSQALSGVPGGQHIEFLVMDPVPKEESAHRNFLEKLLVYTELLTPYFVVNRRIHRAGSFFNPEVLAEYQSKVATLGLAETLHELSVEIFSCEDSDDASEYYALRWGLEIFRYRREYFGTPRLESFEGHLLPVGHRAEGVFREAYGDTWMLVPPPAEQEIHTAFRSHDISYVNFADDYFQFINQQEALNDYAVFKQRRLELLDLKDRVTIDRLLINAAHEEIIYETSVPQDLVREHLIKRNYEAAERYVARYIGAQFDPLLRRWDVFIDIGAEGLAAVLELLIHTRRYHRALQLIDLSRGKYSDDFQIRRLIELAFALRQLSIAVYDTRSVQDLESTLHAIDKYRLEIYEVEQARLYLKYLLANRRVDQVQLAADLKIWVEEHPTDWEILGLLGVTLNRLGASQDANQHLQRVLDSSRNGVLLRFLFEHIREHHLDVVLDAYAYRGED